MVKKILTLCCLSVVTVAVAAQDEPYKNPNLSPYERAWDLVGRMTLEEKVSQMTNQADAIDRLGVPTYEWWSEALHGVARAGKATVFPQTIGLAATFDSQAVYETFSIISDEARAKHHEAVRNGERGRNQGLTFWTPNINIFRDPRWGRGMETYGEDPYLTTIMGLAVVKGLQGDGTGKYDKTHACAKHYAAHSGPESKRHSFNVENLSQRDLRETYLPAFKALVTEGNVKEVMCAYQRYEGQPCCSNDRLLTQILREEWGYDNVVVSDCGAIDDFFLPGHHETHSSAVTASAAAVLSGTDLECGFNFPALIEAVEQGLISEGDINVSVFRLMRARFQLGMFDDDELVPWSNLPYSIVESEPHVAKALEMARKSMVLLTNRNNVLPLSKNVKVAVLGPNANDSTMLWANYNGTPSKSVTILEGICNKLPEGSVYYEQGCDYTKSMDEFVHSDGHLYSCEDVVARVADADVLIFVGGICPTLEGEELSLEIPGFMGGDRTTINLPQVQEDMLKALKKTGKPVVFVNCSGSAIALPWEAENLDAILQAWYPGEQGGNAVADVLFGDYNPAGRLPVTFYASDDDLPDFEDYDMSGRTYRYFKGRALFPFGYGLSYTSFEYGKAVADKEMLKVGEGMTLSVPVKNTGDLKGDEVVQIYVRNVDDKEGPIKSLRAFSRASLEAGQEVDVKFELPASTFESFNPVTNLMEVLPGTYELFYGGSSDERDLQKMVITIGG